MTKRESRAVRRLDILFMKEILNDITSTFDTKSIGIVVVEYIYAYIQGDAGFLSSTVGFCTGILFWPLKYLHVTWVLWACQKH